jgi:hypothetical protein
MILIISPSTPLFAIPNGASIAKYTFYYCGVVLQELLFMEILRDPIVTDPIH